MSCQSTVASDVLFLERMGSFIYPAIYPLVSLDQNSQAPTGLLKRDRGSKFTVIDDGSFELLN